MSYGRIMLFVYLIALPIAAYLILNIVRRLRAIRELDARMRREEVGRAFDPYAAMTQPYEVEELLTRTPRRK
jgi:hypothetical protein